MGIDVGRRPLVYEVGSACAVLERTSCAVHFKFVVPRCSFLGLRVTVSTSVELGYDIQNAALYYCVFEKYGSCELSGRLVGMCSADD